MFCTQSPKKAELFLFFNQEYAFRSPYLVDSCEVSEEALGATEQRLVVRTHHQIPDVPLRAKGIQQQFLPVGQTERGQHHKVIFIPHQEGGDG